MIRKLSRFALILACVLCVSYSVYAQRVSTTLDEKYSFSDDKRYAWRESFDHPSEPRHERSHGPKIVKNVNQLLAAKGFVAVKEKPDFYIYYDGGGNVDLGAGGASQVGSGPTTSADIAPNYGLGNGRTLSPTTWMKVNGQIEFHIVDSATRKAVWETIYSKNFRDPDKALKNMDKEVSELVTKSFKDFPPKQKK